MKKSERLDGSKLVRMTATDAAQAIADHYEGEVSWMATRFIDDRIEAARSEPSRAAWEAIRDELLRIRYGGPTMVAPTAPVLPLRIPVSRATVEEFFESEYGRWEDAGRPETVLEAAEAAARTGNDGALASVVLLRAKTRIIIYTTDEAEDVYFAVSSGTFQMHHFRAAERIANILRPIVAKSNPDLVRRWGGPTGE
jgi:hypothetical protein